jgi:hypothetical protein
MIRVPSGHIVDLETNERVEYKAWNPVSNTVSAEYATQNIRGRSTPHVEYVHTGEDVWSMHVWLTTDASLLDDDVDTRTLQDRIAFVKSFMYPDYLRGASDIVLPPHRCMVIRGEWRKAGYLTGFNATEQGPYDVNGLPMIAEVDFQVHILPTKPRGLRDVREWWTH